MIMPRIIAIKNQAFISHNLYQKNTQKKESMSTTIFFSSANEVLKGIFTANFKCVAYD